jgi:hypothetical protein
MSGGQALDVGGVTRSDDGLVELQCGSDDEGIDRTFGGQARFAEEGPGSLCDRAREVLDDDPTIIQNMVDWGVKTRSLADFTENWGWNPDERSAVQGYGEDCAGALGQDSALRGASESIDGLGVED